MKRVFLDTNIVLDLLVRPEYALVVSEILKLGSQQGIKFAVSFLTVANVAYINRKLPLEERNKLISSILYYFDVVDNTSEHLSEALLLEAPDYEDAVQYITALKSGCDAIITRNTKDFKFSKLPLYSPQEFLSVL